MFKRLIAWLYARRQSPPPEPRSGQVWNFTKMSDQIEDLVGLRFVPNPKWRGWSGKKYREMSAGGICYVNDQARRDAQMANARKNPSTAEWRARNLPDECLFI